MGSVGIVLGLLVGAWLGVVVVAGSTGLAQEIRQDSMATHGRSIMEDFHPSPDSW